MAEWRHWREWRHTCALALCEASTRAELQRFAGQRWRRYATACAGLLQTDSAAPSVPSDAVAWHDFETRVRLRNTRQGKSYKHWLFARVETRAGEVARCTVEGGASLIMRDVVRERFRREFSRRGTISLDQPLPGARPDSPSLAELIPANHNPAETVETLDIHRLGQDMATGLMRDGLTDREKLVLFAREQGVSLQNPDLVAAAGCGKTVLFRTHHRALQTIARAVEQRFVNEERALQADLAVAVMRALAPLVLDWARAEYSLRGFFKY